MRRAAGTSWLRPAAHYLVLGLSLESFRAAAGLVHIIMSLHPELSARYVTLNVKGACYVWFLHCGVMIHLTLLLRLESLPALRISDIFIQLSTKYAQFSVFARTNLSLLKIP